MTPKQQAAIVARLVAQEVEKHGQRVKRETSQDVFAATLLTLHDKFDFTPQMLVRCFEAVVAQFDCINGKYAKMEDFYKLLDELGVKIK